MGSSDSKQLVATESTVDGSRRLVLPDRAVLAADALSRLYRSIDRILAVVRAEAAAGTQDRFALGRVRLLARISKKGVNIVELDPRQHNTIAINRNKSDIVLMCMRRDPLGRSTGGVPDNRIADDDTLLFIAIHELAHSMVDDYALSFNGQTVHNTEFREYERYLMRIATSLGLLEPASIPGRLHCSKTMPNPDEAM
jgi:hypothetical protein